MSSDTRDRIATAFGMLFFILFFGLMIYGFLFNNMALWGLFVFAIFACMIATIVFFLIGFIFKTFVDALIFVLTGKQK